MGRLWTGKSTQSWELTKLKLSNGIRGSQLEISQWLILCCAKKECAYHKWILETNVGPEQVYPLE